MHTNRMFRCTAASLVLAASVPMLSFGALVAIDEPSPAKSAEPSAPAPKPSVTQPIETTQAPAPTDISDILAEIVKKHDVPGLSACVVKDGRSVAIGAAGLRVRGKDVPVTINDLWHLGSCTKSMTATLCAVLVDRGVLKWEQTLAQTFPDSADKMLPVFRDVTLSQLCTNRGGIPGDLHPGGLWSKLWNFKGTSTEARRLILDTVTRREPKTMPGKFEYTNGGFSLAGLMAEQATGRAWEDLVQEQVFAPLGITSAGFGPPGEEAKLDQPWGHTNGGKPMPPGPSADNPPAIGPAGRVHMTIADWGRYIAAHLDGEAQLREALAAKSPEVDPAGRNNAVGGKPAPLGPRAALARPADLVSPAGWKILHQPAPLTFEKDNQYAMGWSVTKRPWAAAELAKGTQGRVLTHNGSNTMWFCVAWLAPDANFAVIVCCNQADRGDKACDEAAAALIGKFRK